MASSGHWLRASSAIRVCSGRLNTNIASGACAVNAELPLAALSAGAVWAGLPLAVNSSCDNFYEKTVALDLADVWLRDHIELVNKSERLIRQKLNNIVNQRLPSI